MRCYLPPPPAGSSSCDSAESAAIRPPRLGASVMCHKDPCSAHGLRVTGRRADRSSLKASHITSWRMTCNCSSPWTAPTRRRPSTGSPTARLQSIDGLYKTVYSWTLWSRSRRSRSWALPLSFGLSPRSLLTMSPEALQVASQLKKTRGVTNDHRLTLTPETSPGRAITTSAPRAQFTDERRRSDNRLQHNRHQIWLLQRPSVRRIWGDTRQTLACLQ